MGLIVVYAAWHLPLLLGWLLPFKSPLDDRLDPVHLLLALGGIHVVALAGALASRTVQSGASAGAVSHRKAIPAVIVAVAVIAPILLLADLFLDRGISLSFDLAANRDAAAGPRGLLGQFAGIGTGASLYLLMWAPFRERDRLRVRAAMVLPFLFTGALYLWMGNRQFVMLGLLTLMISMAMVAKVTVLRSIVTMAVALSLAGALLVGFGFARESATAGRQDAFLQAISGITIEDPASPFVSSYVVRSTALYVYFYFGTEYGVLSSYLQIVEPDAPPLSMTAPVFYRRYSDLAGLPSQDDVRAGIHAALQADLALFPRVWSTMYANVFSEAGILGVIALPICLALLHRRLVLDVSKRSDAALRRLTTFYVGVAAGLMFIPTYEVPFMGLLMVLVAEPLLFPEPKGIISDEVMSSHSKRADHLLEQPDA